MSFQQWQSHLMGPRLVLYEQTLKFINNIVHQKLDEALKVVVYQVGVANQSEPSTLPCTQMSDFAGKRQKNRGRVGKQNI